MYNINIDPSLSGKNIILLDNDGEKKIGKPGKSNDIPLYGIGLELYFLYIVISIEFYKHDVILNRVNDHHASVIIKNGTVILEKIGDSKIMLNGKYLTFVTQLNHLDRLLFGSSQYFVFYDPKKKQDNDIIATFDMLQDEIALNSGLKYADSKMSQGIL